jgi:hypothetical protein
VQQRQSEDHGKGRLERGEHDGDRRQLPLGGEEIKDEPEGCACSDQQRLKRSKGRKAQPPGVAADR